MYNITNSTDITEVIVSIAENVPSLFPMLLLFIYATITLGGAFANQRRVGFTNIPMWLSIGGLVTTTSAFILFIVDGLISLAWVGVFVAVTLFSVLWFFFSGEDN